MVVAEGEISGGEQPPGTVGGVSTAALLREARDDDKVKALVLRVDSPGGEVFASEQIRREIEGLKAAGKPVVVSMGDLAASGGYWISMNADRIYADPSTITGSIGIFGLIPTIPRTLDKIGVHTDGVGTTRIAGAFDITRPLAPEVGQVIQSVIDKGYRDFTGKVAQARKQPLAQIDAVARGRVWSGAQAKERGLVDELGGLQAAIDDVATRAKLGKPDDYRVRYIEKMATPFERFFSGFVEQPRRHCVVAAVRMGAGLVRPAPARQGDAAGRRRPALPRRRGAADPRRAGEVAGVLLLRVLRRCAWPRSRSRHGGAFAVVTNSNSLPPEGKERLFPDTAKTLLGSTRGFSDSPSMARSENGVHPCTPP